MSASVQQPDSNTARSGTIVSRRMIEQWPAALIAAGHRVSTRGAVTLDVSRAES